MGSTSCQLPLDLVEELDRRRGLAGVKSRSAYIKKMVTFGIAALAEVQSGKHNMGSPQNFFEMPVQVSLSWSMPILRQLTDLIRQQYGLTAPDPIPRGSFTAAIRDLVPWGMLREDFFQEKRMKMLEAQAAGAQPTLEAYNDLSMREQ